MQPPNPQGARSDKQASGLIKYDGAKLRVFVRKGRPLPGFALFPHRLEVPRCIRSTPTVSDVHKAQALGMLGEYYV